MFTKENAAELGRRGGQRTAERHGRAHFQSIGRKGWEATTAKHFDGDEEKHKQFIRDLGAHIYWLYSGQPPRLEVGGLNIFRRPHHPAHRHMPF